MTGSKTSPEADIVNLETDEPESGTVNLERGESGPGIASSERSELATGTADPPSKGPDAGTTPNEKSSSFRAILRLDSWRTSPALKEADEWSNGELSRSIALVRRQGYVPMVIATLGFLIGSGLAFLIWFLTDNVMFGAVALVVLGYGSEIILILALINRTRELRLVTSLLETITLLETHPAKWTNLNFRGQINRRLETVAKMLERLPLQLRPRDRATRSWLLKRSYGGAAAIRELKVWVAAPNPFTFTDLANRLTTDLQTILRGKWYELPQASVPEIPEPRKIGARAIFTVMAVLCVAGAAAILVEKNIFGDAAQVLSPVLGAIAVAFLSLAGVSTSKIHAAAEAAGEFGPK